MKTLFIIVAILLASCAQGPQGIPGIPGNTGPIGETGATGPQGAAGADGTIIVPIQFCPGVTPTYPNKFPEYGLCINNQVYAVYSANDGFLTLTPPGTYNSNAVGSNCNFKILVNCVIQSL